MSVYYLLNIQLTLTLGTDILARGDRFAASETGISVTSRRDAKAFMPYLIESTFKLSSSLIGGKRINQVSQHWFLLGDTVQLSQLYLHCLSCGDSLQCQRATTCTIRLGTTCREKEEFGKLRRVGAGQTTCVATAAPCHVYFSLSLRTQTHSLHNTSYHVLVIVVLSCCPNYNTKV